MFTQTFTKAGAYPMVVLIHRPRIKVVYVKKLIQRLRAKADGSEKEN